MLVFSRVALQWRAASVWATAMVSPPPLPSLPFFFFPSSPIPVHLVRCFPPPSPSPHFHRPHLFAGFTTACPASLRYGGFALPPPPSSHSFPPLIHFSLCLPLASLAPVSPLPFHPHLQLQRKRIR
jgi:hypothetical protein